MWIAVIVVLALALLVLGWFCLEAGETDLALPAGGGIAAVLLPLLLMPQENGLGPLAIGGAVVLGIAVFGLILYLMRSHGRTQARRDKDRRD